MSKNLRKNERVLPHGHIERISRDIPVDHDAVYSNPIHVHRRGNSIAARRPGPVCRTQELETGLAIRVAGDGVSLAEYGSLLGRLAGAHGCCGDRSQQVFPLAMQMRLKEDRLRLEAKGYDEAVGSGEWGVIWDEAERTVNRA